MTGWLTPTNRETSSLTTGELSINTPRRAFSVIPPRHDEAMTSQLSFLTTPSDPSAPETLDWRLDERTKEIGRAGIAKARAALAHSRSHNQRDAAQAAA